MAAPTAAAFFDLDRTLMAGSSAFHFARASFRAGFLSRRQIVRDALTQLRFRMRGSTDELADVLRERMLGSIASRKASDLARLAPDIMAGILPRIFPEMLEVVHSHQDAGRPAYIVTAAPQEIAELLARTLAMEGGIATRAEIVDGVYTGRLEGPFAYAEGKAKALEEFAAGNNLDLGSSWAYSDSASDLPMLRAVGHPVAVNPDAELASVAKREGWEIMHFEKLRRRLAIAGSTLIAAAVGGSGTFLVARRRRGRKRLRSPRWLRRPLRVLRLR